MSKPSHLAKREQLERMRAQGIDLLQESSEVYREAFLATIRLLLGAIARCQKIGESRTYETVLVQFAAGVAKMAGVQEVVLCGCPACTEALTTLRTHLNSVATIRAALDRYMEAFGAMQGKRLLPS